MAAIPPIPRPSSCSSRPVVLGAVALLLFALVGTCLADGVAFGKIGSVVSLPCESSRHTEMFMFWETPLGVVAPGYNVSRTKYKYDVLTGDMKIYIHKMEETGKYSCYCRNLDSGKVMVSSIDLSIEHWKAAGNSGILAILYRCIAIVSVSIVILGGWIAHMVWKKFVQEKTYVVDDIDQLESMDGDVELEQLNP